MRTILGTFLLDFNKAFDRKVGDKPIRKSNPIRKVRTMLLGYSDRIQNCLNGWSSEELFMKENQTGKRHQV